MPTSLFFTLYFIFCILTSSFIYCFFSILSFLSTSIAYFKFSSSLVIVLHLLSKLLLTCKFQLKSFVWFKENSWCAAISRLLVTIAHRDLSELWVLYRHLTENMWIPICYTSRTSCNVAKIRPSDFTTIFSSPRTHHLTIYQGKLMPPVPHPQIHLFSLQNMSLNRAFFLSLFVLSTSRANIYFRSRASRAGSDAFRPVVKGYSFFTRLLYTTVCALVNRSQPAGYVPTTTWFAFSRSHLYNIGGAVVMVRGETAQQ